MVVATSLYCPSWYSIAAPPALYLLPLLHFAYCPSWKFLFLPLLPFTYCPSCILLTAPPENSFSCPSCPLLTAPPAAIVPLLLLRASDWCHLISWPLWQYRLWNFKGFLLKINCIKWNLEAEFVAKSFFFKLKFQKVIFFPNIKIQFLIIVDVSSLNVMNWKFKLTLFQVQIQILWVGVPILKNWLDIQVDPLASSNSNFVDRSSKFWQLIGNSSWPSSKFKFKFCG